jgi:hypothetical protein
MARSMLVAALVALLVAVASGCGSSSGDEDVASLDGGTTTTEEESAQAAGDDEEEDPQEAALKWAKCMREHGVDVPDPKFDRQGRGTFRVGGPGSGVDPRSERFQNAREACGSPFGNAGPPELSEEDRAALQESLLEFAKCMREHGIDMPDPQFGEGGGGVFGFGGPGFKVDPESPRFQEAQKACAPILQELRQRVAPGGAS